MQAFEIAKERYNKVNIDVEAALEIAAKQALSINCWQGDDIQGFESGSSLSGGIQVTGSYPGKARNFEELTADFTRAISLIPGKKRINLHASYAVSDDPNMMRNQISYEHFKPWVDYAKQEKIGIDFNPTLFGDRHVKDDMTLASPDEATRRFWIEHCQASREIAQKIGEALQDEVLNNLWIADGLKDSPADRLGPRLRLKDSLDEIFATPCDHVIDSVESKVFGIGLESYTVGSHEFYLNYAAHNPGVYCLLDLGHYHPTESVADKISAMLCFFDRLPLHITRSVRWDSDHVPSFNDDLRELFQEIIRGNALEKTILGVDFFDASINRVAAWVIGSRNVQKALLWALLEDSNALKTCQDEANFTKRFVLAEDRKTLPFGAIWDEYCRRQGVPLDGEWYEHVLQYEADVLMKRV